MQFCQNNYMYMYITTGPLLTEKARMNLCEGDWWVKVDLNKTYMYIFIEKSSRGIRRTCNHFVSLRVQSNGFTSTSTNHQLLTFIFWITFRDTSDYDEDCLEGLVCWHEEDGGGVVPGCSGTPHTDYEYCIDPIAIQPKAITERGRLNACEGDWWVKAIVISCSIFFFLEDRITLCMCPNYS